MNSDDHPGLRLARDSGCKYKNQLQMMIRSGLIGIISLSEMSSWVYPLHFIDFETTMVALPFNKGRKPYEGIAFQFSHHVIQEDGEVET